MKESNLEKHILQKPKSQQEASTSLTPKPQTPNTKLPLSAYLCRPAQPFGNSNFKL